VNVSIVPFQPDDIPFGKRLTDEEGWHRTTADWARLLRIEPGGFFKAHVDGTDAGVAAITDYGKVAWIHSVIVAKDFRCKGIGRLLMDACTDYAEQKGTRSIKLDAVPGAKEFYENLGFKTESESLRFTRKGERGSALVQRMRHEDLRQIVTFDHQMTRIDRSRVLEELYKDNPDWAFFARDSHGVRGYLLGRPSDLWINLGPCVCMPGSGQWFVKMVSSAMSTAPENTYRMCVSGTNREALMGMKRMNFEAAQPSTRMYLGEKFVETEANYAMISPEKG
jgi:GNAT superfamily N-acetyltransferase